MNKLNITLEERKWIAENAIKTVGNENRKFRVIDIEAVRKKFRTDRFNAGLAATISILPIKEDVKKDRNYTFSNFNDRVNDVIHGIYIGLDRNGEPRFKKITISGSHDFDLTRNDDLDTWLIARWHPQIIGSPTENNPYFKIYDATENILNNSKRVESMLIAVDRIKKMKLKEKIYFLRYLQVNIHNSYTEPLIDGLLLDYASNNPFSFNEKFQSSSRSLYEIFHTAIVLGLIQHQPDVGYKYNGLKIGTVEFDVIATLNKDKAILSSLLDNISKNDLLQKDIESRTKQVAAAQGSGSGESFVNADQGDTGGNEGNQNEDDFF